MAGERENYAFGGIFIELHDAGVQCELVLASAGVDAGCNTESDWSPSPPAVPSKVDTVSFEAIANDKFFAAMEETKFALGKKLFDLRYGGNNKKAVAPPTPLAPRKTTGRASSFDKNDAVSAAVTSNSENTAPRSPRVNQSAVKAASTVVKPAVPTGNELAKLNAELITKLRQQADLTARGQRKVQLLEKKLCHLIVYVKRTAREAAGKDKSVTAQQSVQTSPVRTSAAPQSMPEEPTARRMPPQRRPVIPPGASQAYYPGGASATSPRPGRPPVPVPAPTPSALNQSMNVGSMSFAAGLDNLLCIDDNDDDEPDRAAPNRSLFSPMKDFQGRNYDDLSEANISIQSNPLLQRAPDTIPTPGAQDHSTLDLSFHPERSYTDTPEMASRSSGLQGVDAFSPIARNHEIVHNKIAPVPGARQNMHAALQSHKPLLLNRPARPAGMAVGKPQLQLVQPPASSRAALGAPTSNASSPVRGGGNSPMRSPVKRLFPAGPMQAMPAGPAVAPESATATQQAQAQNEELRRQLAQTHRTVQKLEQSVNSLNIRNKVPIYH
jgi:hypothetical protein